ncbi:MAG: hypothetical protein FWE03_03805 [Firmicutes bacterium]|nr:hypothetical protein [Bacillota bacterium]
MTKKNVNAVIKLSQAKNETTKKQGSIKRTGVAAFYFAILCSVFLLPFAGGFLYLGIDLGLLNDHSDGILVFYMCLGIAIMLVLIVLILYLVQIMFKIKISRLVKDKKPLNAKIIKAEKGFGLMPFLGNRTNFSRLIFEYEYYDANYQKILVKTRFLKEDEDRFYEGKEFLILSSDDNRLNLILN